MIVPLYRSAATVEELVTRIAAALGGAGLQFEVVLVDDASPDDGLERALRNPAGDALRALRHRRNQGQHRAVLNGLEAARGDWLVSLDADLQDPPEAIPELLREVRARQLEVLFAGRVGRYQSPLRHLTSRLFKRCLSLLTGVPADAGMYFVLAASALGRLQRRDGRGAFVVAMVGLAGLRSASLPVQRAPRTEGRSAYRGWDRLRRGLSALSFAAVGRFRRPRTPAPAATDLEVVR